MMNIVTREARFASVALLLGSGYLWLARDLNGSIAAYSHKPFKLDDGRWFMEEGKSKEMWMWVDDGDLYNFVKWEDDEPVNIREWLEKEEKEMKMYSVKDGELECREVDVDFFEKNTTLGGLLTPRELDRDNNIIPDDATVVNMDSRNSGKSAILEKAKEIDSKILADLGSSCGELTVSPLMRFPFLTTNMMSTEGQDWDETDWNNDNSPVSNQVQPCGYMVDSNNQIHDVASMYPPRQLSLADLDNVKVHDRICLELNNIYEKKNADYGNSFENSLDKHGLIAGIIRMDDKMSRLISLNSKKEQQVMDESLRDTLMDLANYAIMSVMWLDEQ